MFTVTDAARARLFGFLTDDPQDVAVRLVRRGRHSRLQRDNARPGDTLFTFQGRTVLLLNKEFADKLVDRTLSLRETNDGPRLKLLRSSQPD